MYFFGRDFLTDEIPTKTCLPIVDITFSLQPDSIWVIKQTFYVVPGRSGTSGDPETQEHYNNTGIIHITLSRLDKPYSS